MREVRYPPPWNWEGLDEDAAAESWRRLSAWDSWFVARYDLAHCLRTCMSRDTRRTEAAWVDRW
jgi:hypothetical protein